MYEHTKLNAALQALGDLLRDQGHDYTIVAIGGAALALTGLIVRATEDVDVVAVIRDGVLVTAEPLPRPLEQAVVELATVLDLHPRWLNAGPTSLLRHGLPEGFLSRCSRRTWGGLTVLFADRVDQIHFKVLAASGPHDKHFHDLRQLQPTREELVAAVAWARTQATGEVFEAELDSLVSALGFEFHDE